MSKNPIFPARSTDFERPGVGLAATALEATPQGPHGSRPMPAPTRPFYYITVAWRSIFEKLLPMLSTATWTLSAGPTSIRRTWSSPCFTSSEASTKRRRVGDCRHEVVRPDLARVDRGEDRGTGDDGAERLHDVERQRRPPVARRVIEAAIGIEPD
jgi:hypothetical protein